MLTIEIIESAINYKNHATEFLLGEHPIATMPLKLLFSQHTACDVLKQKYLVTMHISEVRINLPWTTTQAYGADGRASEATSNIRANDDADEAFNHIADVGVGVSYWVAYIKFESALAIEVGQKRLTALDGSTVAWVTDAGRLSFLTTLPAMNERRRGLSIEHSHTIRRCSVTTTGGRERSQTRCKAFGIGTEVIRECGRNCSGESSKDSKDSGELHDK